MIQFLFIIFKIILKCLHLQEAKVWNKHMACWEDDFF